MEDEALGLIKASHASGGSLCTPVGEFRKAELAEALGKAEDQARDDHGRFASGGGGAGGAKAAAPAKGLKGAEQAPLTVAGHASASNAHAAERAAIMQASGGKGLDAAQREAFDLHDRASRLHAEAKDELEASAAHAAAKTGEAAHYAQRAASFADSAKKMSAKANKASAAIGRS